MKNTKKSTQVFQTKKNLKKSSENIPDIKDQVEVAKMLSAKFSTSYGYDFTELFSEAQDKLLLISKNYISQVGNNYMTYLKSSLRGYLMNYIRDHSFKAHVPRRLKEIYMKTRKYSSFMIASIHTKWSEDEIRNAHETVKKFRHYNVKKFESWNTEENYLTTKNNFNISSMIVEEANVNEELLMDVYVNEVPEENLIHLYGENWKDEVEVQVGRLKTVCKEQDLFNEKS